MANKFSDSWNDAAIAGAWDEKTDPNARPMIIYSASKAESERQAWKWVEEKNPSFVFNSVLPCFNVSLFLHFFLINIFANRCIQVGRSVHPENPGSTMGFVRQLLKGDATAFMLPERKSHRELNRLLFCYRFSF